MIKGNLEELKDIRLFLFDMDGTIYLGNNLFSFTKELLQTIKEQGKTYLFMTNNSSKGVDAYIEKMKKLGIDTEYDDFVTSSQATASYINKNLKGKKLYVSGTESFKKELRGFGVNVFDEYSDDIEGVVSGFDTELTFKKLDDVSRLLTEKDIPYIAANPDLVCPTEYGYVPDCGSVAKMIFNATGKEPYFIGKPRPEMPLFAVERIAKTKDPSVNKENTLVIGDRMYTDIACGINAKVKTLLVLSGETTEEQAKNTDYDIDYIADDCGCLLNILKG